MSVPAVDSSANVQVGESHTMLHLQEHGSPTLHDISSNSQLSTSSTAVPVNRILTPPSSLSSTNHSPGEANKSQASPNSVSGRKRTANGHIKEPQALAQEALKLAASAHHARNSSNVSNASNGSVAELSQQLRTRLTYAMLKVQNGWQSRSLDEVESLASQSPRSTTGRTRHVDQTSPRTNIANRIRREHSDSSSGPDTMEPSHFSKPAIPIQGAGVKSPPGRRALAPPADIIVGQRRKPTPNIHLQTGKPLRPNGTQRTPSQNAAMEADAVETLLFMASPNNSAHHSAPYSPIAASAQANQLYSAQPSPLRGQFPQNDSMISPKRVAFSSDVHSYDHNKDALIKALVDRLDEESSVALDEAVHLMEQHHTAKLST